MQRIVRECEHDDDHHNNDEADSFARRATLTHGAWLALAIVTNRSLWAIEKVLSVRGIFLCYALARE